ncbi:MAG: ester cyclase [Gammaproteobacteria bacterium]|nr:ester cyclase [Pseudomonadales bacterium]
MKKEILQSFIQKVWNEGDVNAIAGYIADTYTVMHDPGDPWDGMALDVAGFQHRVSSSRAPVPDQVFEIQELYENENSVCITWLWSGTHLGEIAGIPPSGKTLRMSGATVYYFQNDRITGHWQITDRLGVFQQLQRNRNPET